ncbi:MAG TPA: MMPL family transporter [Flavobacteriales bacterium]|nr:MMPL family transporter [Flavobacteriales bacterium]
MWAWIASKILRYRIQMLSVLALITAFWLYMAITGIRINHKFQTMLPEKDTANIVFQDMKKRFGEDGMVMVIGINDKDLYTPEKFRNWKKLGADLRTIDGVDSVFSEADMYGLYKNDSLKKFEILPLCREIPDTPEELDSTRKLIHSFPFYNGILYNDVTGAHLMMVFINPNKFNSKERGTTIPEVVAIGEKYESVFGSIHFSGLPFIRETLFNTLKSELRFFIGFSAAVTCLILFLFFRSIRVIIACMIVIIVGVIWAFGTMGLLGYEISQLMALIPPLMIVIAIPNCIYLITKYHQEFMRAGNKYRALNMVIRKIGGATLMTNATTALGFSTFIITENDKLREFGMVSAINVISLFFLSIIIIPIVFSYMRNPSVKQTKHLEKRWVEHSIDFLVNLVSRRRWLVYLSTIAVIIVGIIGVSLVRTTGAITEDLPDSSRVKKDLVFIEENFGGMVPFEIIIDFKSKGQLKNPNHAIRNLQKVDSIQRVLDNEDYFSKSLAVTDALKFVNQAFNGGEMESYRLPGKRDFIYLKPYFERLKENKNGPGLKGFIDSTETQSRITMQVKDLGAKQLVAIEYRLEKKIDGILNPDRREVDSSFNAAFATKEIERDSSLKLFYENYPRIYNLLVEELADGDSVILAQLEENPDKVYARHSDVDYKEKLQRAINNSRADVIFTGTAVAFAKGTKYLIGNLLSSLVFAIVSISALMALLFRSLRMVMISMLPNLVPLLITGAIMGLFDIPLKVSTVLVFSIALGISVDDAIHFLAKYRQELKTGKSIKESAIHSISEAGVSMMYTSIVLFCGFLIFTFSEFGGTKALGLLISITLMVAMLCNLVILPSLLMSLDKWVTTQAFREPYLEIFDEEIDEDLSSLRIERKDDQEEQFL